MLFTLTYLASYTMTHLVWEEIYEFGHYWKIIINFNFIILADLFCLFVCDAETLFQKRPETSVNKRILQVIRLENVDESLF